MELFFDTKKGTAVGEVKIVDINNPEIDWLIGTEAKINLEEEIELLDGASAEFDQSLVDQGKLSPVFFGSALTNFGVETFLKHFLRMTTSPLPRMSDHGEIDPMTEPDFSAFVFKIQANMNKAHRGQDCLHADLFRGVRGGHERVPCAGEEGSEALPAPADDGK